MPDEFRPFPLPSLAYRFWSKVEKTPTCWLWRGYRNNHGYGTISVGGRTKRTSYAHRVSWVLANGPVPAGLHVLHRCDVPACVRPDHLFLGTHRDNMRGMAAKRRHPGASEALIAASAATRFQAGHTRPPPTIGERHPSHRLTEEQVLAIRATPHTYGSGPDLARRYGVSVQTIRGVRYGKTWKHLPLKASPETTP